MLLLPRKLTCPLFVHERRQLFEQVGSNERLSRIAQPNYVSIPVFDGVPDPFEGLPRIEIIGKGHEGLDTSSIAFPREAKGSKDKEKQGKTSKPLLMKASSSLARAKWPAMASIFVRAVVHLASNVRFCIG